MKKSLLWCLTISLCLPLNGTTQVGLRSWLTSLLYRAQNAVVAQYRHAPKTTAVVGVASVAGLVGLAAAGNALYKRYYAHSPIKTSFADMPYPCAVAEVKMKGEDTHVIAYNAPYFLAAVFDGHGSDAISKFLAKGDPKWDIKPLHEVIFEGIKTAKKETTIDQVLKEAFLHEDKKLFTTFFEPDGDLKLPLTDERGEIIEENNKIRRGGSTAVVTVVNTQNKSFVIAWAGDSRGLVVDQAGGVKHHTVDHRPDNPGEKERILKNYDASEHGKVIIGEKKDRLAGGLNVSRSFGDFSKKYLPNGKPDIVSAEPQVISGILVLGDIIFVGCDGVFEAENMTEDMTNARVAQTLSGKEGSAKQVAKMTIAGNDKRMEILAANVAAQALESGIKAREATKARGESIKDPHDDITALVVDVSR